MNTIKSTMLVIQKVKVAKQIKKQNVELLQKQMECLIVLWLHPQHAQGFMKTQPQCVETGMLLGPQVGVPDGYAYLLACSSGPCDFVKILLENSQDHIHSCGGWPIRPLTWLFAKEVSISKRALSSN